MGDRDGNYDKDKDVDIDGLICSYNCIWKDNELWFELLCFVIQCGLFFGVIVEDKQNYFNKKIIIIVLEKFFLFGNQRIVLELDDIIKGKDNQVIFFFKKINLLSLYFILYYQFIFEIYRRR